MIKFFRKIRQNMLKENRFGQYLLYALGEIVLVVIGILIALNINNWNQEQTNKRKSKELLTGMTKDLAQDIANHDRMIAFYKNRLDFFERHLQKTDFGQTHVDTLFLIFDSSAGAHTIADRSYQKAKNLGIAQLCTDDSLSMRINQYYIQRAEVTNMLFDYDFDITQKQNDYWMTQQDGLEFDFKSTIAVPLMQDSIERKNNAVAMISSPLGRNNIKMECMVKEMMYGYNLGMKQEVQTLLTDIETYLNNN